MVEKKVWEEYTDWLIDRIGFKRPKKYSELFKALNSIEFYWGLDRDENRALGGLRLRRVASLELQNGLRGINCTVLEMMIALSIRLDDDYIGDPGDPKPDLFFARMLENLGLDRLDNRHFDAGECEKIVKKWLDRRFDRRGNGSPFPVKRDKRDQRKREIWDQAITYIHEKWEF